MPPRCTMQRRRGSGLPLLLALLSTRWAVLPPGLGDGSLLLLRGFECDGLGVIAGCGQEFVGGDGRGASGSFVHALGLTPRCGRARWTLENFRVRSCVSECIKPYGLFLENGKARCSVNLWSWVTGNSPPALPFIPGVRFALPDDEGQSLPSPRPLGYWGEATLPRCVPPM